MKTVKKLMMIALALVLASSGVYAQDMTSKNGIPILPESGNWSLGFDAVPVAAFFGSLMYASGGGGSSAPAAFKGPLAITGKYMASENTAYRVRFGINSTSATTANKVHDDASAIAAATAGNPDPMLWLDDEQKIGTMGVSIGGGLQKYRGNGRVKGYYGGELQFMMSSTKTTVAYGNPFSASNFTPTSTYDFGAMSDSAANGRIKEIKPGGTIGFGLRGFIGVEYFVAAKVSLSAEYGWGLSMTTAAEGTASVETLNTTANGGLETAAPTGKTSGLSIAADVGNGFGAGGGAINLNFYF